MAPTTETPVLTTEPCQQPVEPTATAAGVALPALTTVLLAVRHDALLDTERYLDEARVPFGGE
jgi:hypothetical protein